MKISLSVRATAGVFCRRRRNECGNNPNNFAFWKKILHHNTFGDLTTFVLMTMSDIIFSSLIISQIHNLDGSFLVQIEKDPKQCYVLCATAHIIDCKDD